MALDILKWSDAYLTGIRVIDNDHKQLFELTDALGACAEKGDASERMGGIIDRLVNYANEHFIREEQFMVSCGFPDLEAHAKEHRRATKEIYGIRSLYRSHPDQIDPIKVAEFFARWLADHIQGRDQRYVPYIRGDEAHMKDGSPFVVHRAAPGQPIDMQLETVSVEVPGDKAELLRVCARVLAEGGANAVQLSKILTKISSLDPSEKRLKKISQRYMKNTS